MKHGIARKQRCRNRESRKIFRWNLQMHWHCTAAEPTWHRVLSRSGALNYYLELIYISLRSFKFTLYYGFLVCCCSITLFLFGFLLVHACTLNHYTYCEFVSIYTLGVLQPFNAYQSEITIVILLDRKWIYMIEFQFPCRTDSIYLITHHIDNLLCYVNYNRYESFLFNASRVLTISS